MATSEQLNTFVKEQIERLRDRIDLHDLATRRGLTRPGGKGNYSNPNDGGHSPAISIFTEKKSRRQYWKDHRGDGDDSTGDFLDFDRVFRDATASLWERIKFLSDEYGVPFNPPREERSGPAPQLSQEEWLTRECLKQPELATAYLESRGIPAATINRAILRKSVGYSDWTSPKTPAGHAGHGGAAVAFICRDLMTNAPLAIDKRFIDPELNGKVKTQTHGQKESLGWCIDRAAFFSAQTAYVVESAINALCIEACGFKGASAFALRGTGNADNIDWRLFIGKRVVLALDADKPQENGRRPGPEAAWVVYEKLTALNIAAQIVDTAKWYEDEVNDCADIAKKYGIQELKERLEKIEPWAIAGLPGQNAPLGRSRVFLPAHDWAVYWRFRCKADFTSYVSKVENDDDGKENMKIEDVAGFRVASLSRVSISSATSTMSGEADAMPTTVFAISVQVARHGDVLLRRVLDDERLHNVEQWKKIGPIFSPPRFSRLLNMLERTAHCGARDAVNFVGLAWRDGKPIVNEGPDCYFTEPEKQCPYHNLTFPAGRIDDARRVIEAYQSTFKANAAAQVLAWALGAHLKAFIGFWPHMVMQADKGSGKSTFIKRLERTIGFTMFSGQSLQTEFRLITSTSCTSHPVGWEELSARRQDIIDRAVGILQETYQHTVTRRGSDLTEFLLSAPVLLAGEDVPVRSLTGKVVRADLSHRKGPRMSEDLPRFPVRQWLDFLATLNRKQVQDALIDSEQWLRRACRASTEDVGATRMVENYAAVLTGWRLLCEFAGVERGIGDFPTDLRAEMNAHIKQTAPDREPYVWILELLVGEIESKEYNLPHKIESIDGIPCLILRPAHVMDHIAKSPRLRDHWNSLPVKTGRVFARQLANSGIALTTESGDKAIPREFDKIIGGARHAHMWALNLDKMAELGVHLSIPTEQASYFDAMRQAANE